MIPRKISNNSVEEMALSVLRDSDEGSQHPFLIADGPAVNLCLCPTVNLKPSNTLGELNGKAKSGILPLFGALRNDDKQTSIE